MDGNKKITGIVFAGIIALAVTACMVKQPGYVSLYIDNFTSVNDTIGPGKAPLNMLDTAMTRVIKPTNEIEAEQRGIFQPAEQISEISSDSDYQYEVEQLPAAIIDSVQIPRYQMIGSGKQLTVKPDTSFAVEQLQILQSRNRLQSEFELKQLILFKNDTISVLRKQLHELQYSGTIAKDTIYEFIVTAEVPVVENRQTDFLTRQLLRTKDEQIQTLQNQLNAMQNAAAKTPQTTLTTTEPAQEKPLSSQQSDPLTLQLFQAQNDTIQLLRSQLWNLQIQPRKTDSVYIEKKAEEIQPAKELVTKQVTPDPFQVLQDTLQFLKTRLLSLEERAFPYTDTSALDRQDEKEAPYKAETDTTLIVASYERGGIKPLKEDSVLKQIKELCDNKNVIRITLSGYTDRSGSEIINKEITNRRLNYLSEKITQWIAKEKIFFQNFGDTFASDTMVNDERRIEIEISARERQ